MILNVYAAHMNENKYFGNSLVSENELDFRSTDKKHIQIKII